MQATFMKPVVIIALAFAAVLVSCREAEQEPDGGFCSYKDTEIPARVIDIVRISPTQYDLTFKLDSNIYRPAPEDTVHFYMENGIYLDKTVFDSLGVETGKVYTFLVREIAEGSCTPFLTQIAMKPVTQ